MEDGYYKEEEEEEEGQLTVSVIFRVQVPAGSSPQVWTDMKSQFRKPLEDMSLSRSASSTVVVPVGTNTC